MMPKEHFRFSPILAATLHSVSDRISGSLRLEARIESRFPTRNRSNFGLSLPPRPHLAGCPHRTSIGAHLQERLLHRLSRGAGLQIIHHRGECPHDIFDLFNCHMGLTPGRPRLGKRRRITARARAEQCAAPRRKGCYQPETSQLWNRWLPSPLPLLSGGCGFGAMAR